MSIMKYDSGLNCASEVENIGKVIILVNLWEHGHSWP